MRGAASESSSQSKMSAAFRYSPEQIFSLRTQCSGLPRDLKRYLFYLGISNRAHSCCATFNDERRIPTRVTFKKNQTKKRLQPIQRHLTLVRMDEPGEEKERTDETQPQLIPVYITGVRRKKTRPIEVRLPCLVKIPRGTPPKCATRIRHPSILLTNARSIRNKMDEFRLITNKVKPGIAIISESWLDSTTDNSYLDISQY